MNFSDDQKHGATIEMLEEALGYLRRLPQVHATQAMCERIEGHLKEPTQVLVSRATADGFVLRGGSFLPNGLPGFGVRLKLPDRLHFWAYKPSPAEGYRRAEREVVATMFSGGIRMKLDFESEQERARYQVTVARRGAPLGQPR